MVDAAQPQRPSFSFGEARSIIMRGEILLAAGVLGILAIMLVPLPAFLLDMLLALSITTSILVLMTALLIKKPLEFTAFPSVLLLTTLMRLALNIATTPAHLIEWTDRRACRWPGDRGVRSVRNGRRVRDRRDRVRDFGDRELRSHHPRLDTDRGSTRRRFTLDSMPGKQMAIDADLSSGLINEHEARARRKALEEESAFFGAMDGASKFVRGDAIAGLLIVFINIIGGIIIGVRLARHDVRRRRKTYTLLTVGDGLVTQVPALIISVASGLLVTKAGIDGAADKALAKQLATYPQALGIVSVCAFGVGVLPGMPLLPFWVLGRGLRLARLAHLSSEQERGENRRGNAGARRADGRNARLFARDGRSAHRAGLCAAAADQ